MQASKGWLKLSCYCCLPLLDNEKSSNSLRSVRFYWTKAKNINSLLKLSSYCCLLLLPLQSRNNCNVGFWLVEMAISTNQKPTIYRDLYDNRVKCPNGPQGAKSPFPKGPQVPKEPLEFVLYFSAIMMSQWKILAVSWSLWTFTALTIINMIIDVPSRQWWNIKLKSHFSYNFCGVVT